MRNGIGRPTWVPPIELFDAYPSMSLRALAAKYGKSPETIKRALRDAGVELRPLKVALGRIEWSKDDHRKMRRLYEEDLLSIQSIAALMGAGYKAIRNALLREGIPFRKRNTVGLHKLLPETREKIRQSKLGSKNPNYGKRPSEEALRVLELGRKLGMSKAARRKASQTRIERGLSKGDKNPMANPESVRKWAKSNALSPNMKERELGRVLEETCPGRFQFNVDGEVVIGNKIPDFVEIEGGNRLIELFGDYWHQGEDPQGRIGFFMTFGYETLVIWESELKERLKLIERIERFVE